MQQSKFLLFCEDKCDDQWVEMRQNHEYVKMLMYDVA